MRRNRRATLLALCVLIPAALVLSGAVAVPSRKSSHRRPAHTRLPIITGVPQVGRILHGSRGRWIRASRFTYRWKLCNAHGTRCKVLGKAKRPRHKPAAYLVTASDVGRTIRLTVVAGNKWGQSSATSKASTVIRGKTFGTTPTGTVPPTKGATPGVPVSMAWYPAFEEGVMPVSAIPWTKLTQVDNFSLVTETSAPFLGAGSDQINAAEERNFVAAAHAHGDQAFVTIGGSSDQHWSTACLPANQSKFSDAIVSHLRTYGYDGVDLDIEEGTFIESSNLVSCVRAIHDAVTAVKVNGHVPQVSADEGDWYVSWYRPLVPYVDQLNMMSYEAYCNPSGCSDAPAGAGTDHLSFATWISGNERAGWPASKLTMGFATSGDACGSPQGCWAMYNYVTLGTLTGQATSTSIPVGALGAAIPAGKIVLATTGNYPAHQQIVTTTGAAQGATSIPLSGNPTLNYAYGSGNLALSAYDGPPGCGPAAAYAAANGLAGTGLWTPPDEAAHHSGQTPCLDAIASAVTVH